MEAASVNLAAGTAAADPHHHHGPPPANKSSRVEPQLLGMLLFIISEIMVFGAFFTAYFFIRVVLSQDWFDFDGFELPVSVAGVNTAILRVVVADDALGAGGRQAREPGGAEGAACCSPRCSARRSSSSRSTSTSTSGSARGANAQASVFFGLTGLHGAHVAHRPDPAVMATVRAFRGHFTPEEHRGVEIPGIYWHFVDVMWIIVYTSIYIL